ncbi:MAG: tRNA preQ1(34) S-adenosylmethionine ribosyltransferase-isomerase QueA [Ruminococcaceae bacterium]|nr:tRNA preQ1(34) S-adenosylmethionine ribosyltransferase-isomerase QueA [Oscillospiraceae bacterium]
MNVNDFDYTLPEELIAQTPLSDRSASRLLVVHKDSGVLEHRHFTDITDLIHPGDCLVLNNSRVIPARLLGHRMPSGGAVELLLLRHVEGDVWETLVRPGKRCRIGDRVVFGNGELIAEITEIKADGNRLVEFSYKGIFNEILATLGEMPLPPYIKEKLHDPERYQTVYSKIEGSAAAPTAGLHFTQPLLKQLERDGVNISYVTLHVGLGTFRPVKSETVEGHVMHTEVYSVTPEAAETMNRTKQNGGRIICVGTTATRVVETLADGKGQMHAGSGETSIFIYPGYQFKMTDALITNFHLPKSTLMMLVSALANRDLILKAYAEAVNEKYRFFSFGDAMFIQ